MKPDLVRRFSRGCCVAAIAVLSACAQKGPPPLYIWGSFPKTQYDALLSPGSQQGDKVATMEADADKARAEGRSLPPGFRAHLGMLKLSAGDPDAARTLWRAEKAAFPESSPYMDQLLQRLEASPKKKDAAT